MKSSLLCPSDGIVVGADITQEWILPWWWKSYKKFNSFPVTFVDFGLSSAANAWCKQHGKVVSLALADTFVREKEEIDGCTAQEWEKIYGKEFWAQRGGWFKKPFACLLTPYERTIWLDLDCEVRGFLQPLFSWADHPSGIAIAADISNVSQGYRPCTTQNVDLGPRPSAPVEPIKYNSGVIVFKKGLSLIEKWAHHSLSSNHLFAGDQDILTQLIFEEQLPVQELPQIFNWSRCKGESSDAVIYHWHGRYGKAVIANNLYPWQEMMS